MNSEDTVFQKFVLYAGDNCKGTKLALDACDSFREDVRIVYVKELTRPLPEWLTGTPTIVETSSMTAYQGTDAIERLSEFEGESGTQLHLPDLSDETSFDRMQDGKVTDSDLDALIQEREKQLPRPKDPVY